MAPKRQRLPCSTVPLTLAAAKPKWQSRKQQGRKSLGALRTPSKAVRPVQRPPGAAAMPRCRVAASRQRAAALACDRGKTDD